MDTIWILVFTVFLASGDVGGAIVTWSASPDGCQMLSIPAREHVKQLVEAHTDEPYTLEMHCLPHRVEVEE